MVNSIGRQNKWGVRKPTNRVCSDRQHLKNLTPFDTGFATLQAELHAVNFQPIKYVEDANVILTLITLTRPVRIPADEHEDMIMQIKRLYTYHPMLVIRQDPYPALIPM